MYCVLVTEDIGTASRNSGFFHVCAEANKELQSARARDLAIITLNKAIGIGSYSFSYRR